MRRYIESEERADARTGLVPARTPARKSPSFNALDPKEMERRLDMWVANTAPKKRRSA